MPPGASIAGALPFIGAAYALRLFRLAHVSFEIKYASRAELVRIAIRVLTAGAFAAQARQFDVVHLAVSS
jgi:hypothetical protein